jgi:Zn-dependent metalloprotease
VAARELRTRLPLYGEVTEPLPTLVIDVDARDGSVVNLVPLVANAWSAVSATGNTLYDGPRTFEAENDPEAEMEYQTRLRGPTVITLNADGQDDVAKALDYATDDTDFSGLPNAEPGVTAHWAAQEVLKYFKEAFDRDGVDNKNAQLSIYLNVSTVASWGLPGGFWGFSAGAGMFPLNIIIFRT